MAEAQACFSMDVLGVSGSHEYLSFLQAVKPTTGHNGQNFFCPDILVMNTIGFK